MQSGSSGHRVVVAETLVAIGGGVVVVVIVVVDVVVTSFIINGTCNGKIGAGYIGFGGGGGGAGGLVVTSLILGLTVVLSGETVEYVGGVGVVTVHGGGGVV
ncbi:MAG TPA: hypothetical protein DEG69_16985 [Flavobacteriaceae bacterium]|nr:hypothetical protein [Flavobacteriaceae bacterium]